MNSSPIALALLFGIGHAGQLAQEAVGRLHVDERDPEVPAERLLDLRGLVLAVQAVIHEHARELIPDRAVDEERRDRRVDTARERAEDAVVAHLLADRLHRSLDHVDRRPVGQQSTAVVEEPLQDRDTVRRVGDLRVELHGVQAALGILHRRDRDDVGVRPDAEPLRLADDRVAVAHPHLLRRLHVGEQHARTVDRQRRAPVLALAGRRHLPAERLGHQLVPVADPEHRDAEVEHPRIQMRRALLVHGRRPARQDDAGGAHLAELGDRDVVRDDLGVDVTLADPPRDQLRVLRPEVDDQDGARMLLRHNVPQWPIPTRCCVW